MAKLLRDFTPIKTSGTEKLGKKWIAYTINGGFCLGKTEEEAIANAEEANARLTRGVPQES